MSGFGLVLSAAAMFGTVIFLCSVGFLLAAQRHHNHQAFQRSDGREPFPEIPLDLMQSASTVTAIETLFGASRALAGAAGIGCRPGAIELRPIKLFRAAQAAATLHSPGGMKRRGQPSHVVCRSSEASSLPNAGDMSVSEPLRTVWFPLSSTMIV